MLQTSQIEKPRCSAKIDHMRLRRAMNLPSDFQNFSSSGFQFEIHVGLRLLIKGSFPVGLDSPAARAPTWLPSQGLCQRYPIEKSSISARREVVDCAFLRRCGMGLCNARFFGRAGSKDRHIRAVGTPWGLGDGCAKRSSGRRKSGSRSNERSFLYTQPTVGTDFGRTHDAAKTNMAGRRVDRLALA